MKPKADEHCVPGCTSVCLQVLDLHLRLIQGIQLWGPGGMDLNKML